jgi:hypothetical protein
MDDDKRQEPEAQARPPQLRELRAVIVANLMGCAPALVTEEAVQGEPDGE